MAATDQQPAPPGADERKPTPRRVVLVRHGQTTFNVEGRLPGQLPNVALTDEGRRQAHQAAVALAASPLSLVVSSPLERAYDTAQIIARGWGLEVRTDERLKDTDLGEWAGLKLDELTKTTPDWKRFVQEPEFAPPGGESLAYVMARAVTVVEDLRRDERAGDLVVLVAHADVIKFIIGHYQGSSVTAAARLHVANASISALRFEGEEPPQVLAVNWTASPGWLLPPLAPAAGTARAPAAATPETAPLA
ncbi:MAG TPA: histidine phosphatase family protein [Ktedonobacterales bacterium]|nr:histidine phosphatase family protein [Ktedonobacterales bacterium]